jgi:tripartite-type tricarboxylate transporter receptor subunit TctC
MLDRIHAVTQDMMKEQAAKNAMSGAGLDPMPMSRAEFSGFVKAEYARWETIVKAAGVPKE